MPEKAPGIPDPPPSTPSGVYPAAEGLLDAGAAAALLSVPESWVRDQARAGEIPHIKLGRYVRFEAGELRAWWVARRCGPGSGPVSAAREAA